MGMKSKANASGGLVGEDSNLLASSPGESPVKPLDLKGERLALKVELKVIRLEIGLLERRGAVIMKELAEKQEAELT